MRAETPLRIGLTGGIGSGKSTVAALLSDRGAVVIDTDRIARELTGPRGPAVSAIGAAFGPEFVDSDGALNRERMRALAFSDPVARRRLEAILHPMIGEETQRRAAGSDASVLVFDVPLLVESGRWRSRVDRVLVVDCTTGTQVDRVMSRAGWTREAVESVIAQQADRRVRRASADAVIYNDGITRSELADTVLALWSQWHDDRC